MNFNVQDAAWRFELSIIKTSKPLVSARIEGFLALRTGIEPFEINLKSPVSKGYLSDVLNIVLNINSEK